MQTWLSGWTIFYWAWWVSWTPFVGILVPTDAVPAGRAPTS